VFPEAFLQRYIVEEEHVRGLAMDLRSPEFSKVLERLAGCEPTVVVGLFEHEADRLYNSAVVVRDGQLVGVNRKQHLIGKENDLFTPGTASPVFELGPGLKFGINICYDMQFAECARDAALAGADDRAAARTTDGKRCRSRVSSPSSGPRDPSRS
jgi:predicted amidohydrolase